MDSQITTARNRQMFGCATLKIAERFGRRWVGCELSADYIEIGKRRTAQMGLAL